MDSWGTPSHGVPRVVYDRMERNEPSAWEKTRTAQVVPPAERAMDDDSPAEIEGVLAQLLQGQDVLDRGVENPRSGADGTDDAEPDDRAKTINEITSSGMFALDGPPEVSDAEKLRFACNAVGGDGAENDRKGPRAWIRSAEAGQEGTDVREPYIHVCRGDEFADSLDASFFAKTFPTLLPFGFGGPRLAEEVILGPEGRSIGGLRTWAGIVLRRHGGRFATHTIFSFLVFNMDVRSKNRRVSMLSATRKNFAEVERIVRSLTADRLAAARAELETSGKTTDDGVKELLRCLSLYGYRQPMSRELRLSMRRKIQSLILCRGVPAIWFTLNPNDITNPVKLRLAAYRTRDPAAAEAFLQGLDKAFKRARLAISDPLSSAEFFHREMTLFFEHYVRVGEESVFGRISHYYGAVETNERGALHVHGLLWLQGNVHLSSMLADIDGEDQAAYRERIVRYVDSVFSEDLDQEGFCAMQAERSVTSDISQFLGDERQFSASFDEEANFCAGATQIHTHSPTCVKYSLGKGGRKGDLCRFKAPWGLVDETAFTGDGVLRIRRSHSMVNRWNKAIAVGFATTMTYLSSSHSVEDPVWKRVAAAADLLPPRAGDGMADGAEVRGDSGAGDDGRQNKTRQFLMKVANRVFTERPLSAWAFLNVSLLYWQVFRQWPHLRRESGAAVADGSVDESILVEEAGQRICRVEAYRHRGDVLRGLCLYDYVSLVRLKRNERDEGPAGWGEVPFESGWAPGGRWAQVLRRPGKQATVCLDGYLSKDFDEDDEGRATEERLCSILRSLAPRISCFVDNVQLLRRSAEDAKRDARQWAASSGDGDPTAVRPDEDGTGEVGVEPGSGYQADSAGSTNRLIDVVRSSIGPNQITAGSPELTAMMQELSRFQQSALSSSSEVQATILPERGPRRINIPGGHSPEPPYRRKGEEKMIRGIQSLSTAPVTGRRAAVRGVLTGFGDDDVQMTAAELEEGVAGASAGMEIRFGASTSFLEAGKALAARLTLNKKQAIAFLIICRQLDLIRRGRKATYASCATRINGITIHSACGFSKDLAAAANAAKDLDGVRLPKQAERFVDGQSRMDWQEKDVLVIDEVSMLGARTLHAVNEQLCRLRGSHQDFGDSSFKAETRHQHDKAHALWKRFTTTVMLDEQVRAAGDPELQRLLRRIRLGVQDRSDLDLLNSRCYREGRRIPWETCITVVTPLNRNRWNLNMEASLAFRAQQRSVMRIFISDHTWKEALPTEEEAIMMLNQGDDSAIPVPAVFMFVPGMPVVVNHNTHQGLKLVNGAGYTALEVVLDKSYPGIVSRQTRRSISGRRRIMLESETTNDVHFCQRKRPWQQNDVSRKGLPCTAAFACTDYKVQGRTLERVALELRGTRTSNIDGRAVSSQCDPYSLYVQLSRCPTLDGIMLVSKLRERDLVGNKVPDEMTDAEARLGQLSDKTVREASGWLDVDSLDSKGTGLDV
ncbi:ATP-dependent DNA helicase PIF1 [Hirsutella rhossiliensis]|uniref:ATP-dependent DNA helicase PIF1 n=1 Tax=Hirsutella rhossiliensis TaxID=111463 RepID=A0A9P8SL34_9HYPO|nr:ATP-dependent DNA helicase PIF1 [Hirsutella rhossiliensis]KAH0966541.1 ATP-dependent DNA helicase PIF1 [Hirsutella rhossiliensis]